MGRKPEVNLEVSSGFFRITAEDAVYNITVLGNPGGVAKVTEKTGEVNSSVNKQPAAEFGSGSDDYYKQVSTDLYRDIGHLAKSLSATMMDIPLEDRRLKRAELDEAGERIEDAKSQLKDIVDMTESATMEIMDCVEDIQVQTNDAQELLSTLKNHKAFMVPEGEGEEDRSDIANSVAAIREQLTRAREIVSGLRDEKPAASAAADQPAQENASRYLFSLDVIFQTLYEFCTNETVKGHLSSVREQSGELFDQDVLLDALNSLAATIAPDEDNFLQFPLTDLLEVLAGACSDEKIGNLFKKMAANLETLFLDQNLPLEVPPGEEAAGAEPAGEDLVGAGDPQVGELGGLLDSTMEELDRLAVGEGMTAPGMSTMSMADQTEIFKKIESTFSIVNTISGDVQKITEALSFQDLSGQQIMKIIKMLSDFQVQLLAIVVSFGSQLKHKEQNASITAEESKRLAQEDVDTYINMIGGPEEEGEAGVLDQDAVNRMLEEMGF